MQDLLYWIWLSLSCTPASKTFKKLLECFDSPLDIYNADQDEIASCISSRNSDYNSLINKSLDRAEQILDFCRTKNVGIITYADEKFPKSLRDIPTPPVLLYYRGNLPDFNRELFISVVGTRSLSAYGRKNAFSISRDLAKAGAVVVSGMALGIDGVALAGALSEEASTVAVIGSGIDVCYPKQHRTLAREIVKRGCVLTEYPPATSPDGKNFPKRNRIISGLSSATLVIEGREQSGALITARHAAEQGKLVYALPGNVDNKNSEGTNLLIKNGARPVLSADDIVRDFLSESPPRLNPFKIAEPDKSELFAALRAYEVVALAPGDSVFTPPKQKKKKQAAVPVEPQAEVPDANLENKLASFDKKTIQFYKKIPVGEECLIESLVDGDTGMRDVMRMLLKLEMSRFVTILPGEKVKRNF